MVNLFLILPLNPKRTRSLLNNPQRKNTVAMYDDNTIEDML